MPGHMHVIPPQAADLSFTHKHIQHRPESTGTHKQGNSKTHTDTQIGRENGEGEKEKKTLY